MNNLNTQPATSNQPNSVDLAVLLETISELKTQLNQQATQVSELKQQLNKLNELGLAEAQPAATSQPTMTATRRNFLKRWGATAAGLVAGASALAASTSTAQAADGDNLILGNSNIASTGTYLTQPTNQSVVAGTALLWVDNNKSGTSTLPTGSAIPNTMYSPSAAQREIKFASIIGTTLSSDFLPGNNAAGAGVFGQFIQNSQHGLGLPGAGVVGYSDIGSGVVGYTSGGSYGIYGYTPGNLGTVTAGVFGDSKDGYGVRGNTVSGVAGVVGVADVYLNPISKAYGGYFQSNYAPLRLYPNNSNAGAPITNDHKKGELYVDTNGELWYCKADGSASTPGTWVNISTPGVTSSVTLQAATPGTAQTGNFNIAGKGIISAPSGNIGLEASAANNYAPLYLKAATASGAPSSGTHYKGEVYVDSLGDAYICVKDSTGGNAGVWRKIAGNDTAAVHLFKSPDRFLDTRAGSLWPATQSQYSGGLPNPLAANTDYTLDLAPDGLRDSTNNKLPANARGILGVVSFSSPAAAGAILKVFPTDIASGTAVSTVLSQVAGANITGGFSLPLPTGRQIKVSATTTYHVVVDLFGYYL